MPRSTKHNYKITLDHINLDFFINKASNNSNKELLYVLNLLIKKKAFVLGNHVGIKNIMIKKNGEIKYEDVIQ